MAPWFRSFVCAVAVADCGATEGPAAVDAAGDAELTDQTAAGLGRSADGGMVSGDANPMADADLATSRRRIGRRRAASVSGCATLGLPWTFIPDTTRDGLPSVRMTVEVVERLIFDATRDVCDAVDTRVVVEPCGDGDGTRFDPRVDQITLCLSDLNRVAATLAVRFGSEPAIRRVSTASDVWMWMLLHELGHATAAEGSGLEAIDREFAADDYSVDWAIDHNRSNVLVSAATYLLVADDVGLPAGHPPARQRGVRILCALAAHDGRFSDAIAQTFPTLEPCRLGAMGGAPRNVRSGAESSSHDLDPEIFRPRSVVHGSSSRRREGSE